VVFVNFHTKEGPKVKDLHDSSPLCPVAALAIDKVGPRPIPFSLGPYLRPYHLAWPQEAKKSKTKIIQNCQHNEHIKSCYCITFSVNVIFRLHGRTIRLVARLHGYFQSMGYGLRVLVHLKQHIQTINEAPQTQPGLGPLGDFRP